MKHMMQTQVLLVITILFFTTMVIVAWAVPKADTAQQPWLSHFVGDPVVVTFITAPTDMSRTTKAVLMDAETAGIVLRFGKEEIFFSFANIMTVEPAR